MDEHTYNQRIAYAIAKVPAHMHKELCQETHGADFDLHTVKVIDVVTLAKYAGINPRWLIFGTQPKDRD